MKKTETTDTSLKVRESKETGKQNWDFVYDEEILDCEGSNFIGIIMEKNTGKFLFYHTIPDLQKGYAICYVYDSLVSLYECNNELCSYPWTDENDSKVVNALNTLDEGSNAWCGENNVLSAIKFDEIENLYF